MNNENNYSNKNNPESTKEHTENIPSHEHAENSVGFDKHNKPVGYGNKKTDGPNRPCD